MNTLRKFTYLLALLIICIGSACSQQIDVGVDNKVLSSDAFLLTPSVVSGNTKLRITLPKERPANLAIVSPDGSWHLVHSKEENIYIVPQEEFAAVNYIDVIVERVKGIRWDDGVSKESLVFNQPGQYKIYLIDNVETELENTFHLMRELTYQ